MSNDIKITIIVVFVMVVTKMLLLMSGRNKKEDTEIMVIWVVVSAVTTLSHNIFALIAIIGIIKIFFLKNDIEKNIRAFFALWSVVPFHFLFDLPLPSVPLLNGNYQRLIMIIWIFPILPQLLNQASMKGRRAFLDIPVLYLTAMGIVVAFSENFNYQITLISSIKETMQLFMDILIPYFLIVLWADSWSRLKVVLFAFMLSGLALSIFGVIEAIMHWNIFSEMVLTGMVPVEESYKARAFLRTRSAFPEPISFGVFTLIAMGMAFAVMFRTKKKLIIKVLIIMIFLAAIYTTQSRGDQISAIMMITLYFFFKMQSSSRFLLLLFMAIVLSVAGYVYKQQSPAGSSKNLDEVDEHGTFDYRKRLFETQLALIPKYPFFGNTMYKKEPSMELMRQGEGIIDPVNTFLTLAVERGLITLFFFVLFILRGVRAALGYVKYGYAVKNQIWVNLGAAMAATIIGLSLALAFTSFFGTNSVFFWFTMGVARAMQLNLKRKQELAKGTDEYDLGYT